METELKALRALGLTEYGARAYTALVALGPSEATTIASAGPVPRTKVYAVLTDLIKRGWVASESGRPRVYRAMSPSDCFDRARERIDSSLDAALPALEAKFADRSKRFAGPMWMLDGAQMIADRARDMVKRARSEIFLAASFPLPGDGRELARALRDAVRRNVRVRVIVPDMEAPLAQPLITMGVELRVMKVPPRVMSIDTREALLALPVPRPDGGMDAKAMWVPAPEILEIIQFITGPLWSSATDNDSRGR